MISAEVSCSQDLRVGPIFFSDDDIMSSTLPPVVESTDGQNSSKIHPSVGTRQVLLSGRRTAVLYYSAVQCSAVQCSAVQCSAVQYSAVQCSAVQCIAVQCSILKCTEFIRESSHHYDAVHSVDKSQ